MSLFRVLLTLLAPLATFSAIDFTTYDYQMYLDDDESFLVAWSVDATQTNITIAVSAPTTGWAGFGLSPTGSMPLSDIAFFWVDDLGNVFLQDRYTTDDRYDGPLLDDRQDLILIAGEEVDGATNVVFTRAITPCDSDSDDQDYAVVSGTSRVIVAWSNSDPTIVELNADEPALSEVSFTGHGQNVASRSVNLLQGTDLQVELEDDTLTFDVTVDNYAMPSDATTYYDTYHQLPVSDGDIFHITKFEPIVTPGNELHVHHLVIYYCSEDRVSEYECSTAAYAWAIGSEGLTFPVNVGLEMSVDYISYVKLQIHYDNPDEVSGVVDSSGLKIYYTPTLREHTAGMLQFGLELGAWQFIPPGMEDAVNIAYCMSECTGADDSGIPETGVYMFSAFLHAHVLGVALELKHIRNGTELPPIAQNWAYDFDYQQSIPLSEHRQILPGDAFQLNCHYNSVGMDRITYGGESTDEEMCQAYTYVYPRPTLSKCISVFTASQYAGFFALAGNAGYWDADEETYDLGGDPYSWPAFDISVQNGTDFYDFLWQETSYEALATREQLCNDIRGESVFSGGDNEELVIPNDYTPYVPDTECSLIDADAVVGYIGGDITPTPTSDTTPTPTAEVVSESNLLCGSVASDGTSPDVSVSVCVDIDADTVTIELSGPEDVWFGVGFDAMSMFDGAWTIVRSGEGSPEYHAVILSTYSPGSAAQDEVVVPQDDTASGDGLAYATIVRDRVGEDYTFPDTPGSINVIFGTGTGLEYVGPMGGHSDPYVVLNLAYEEPTQGPTMADESDETDPNNSDAAYGVSLVSAVVACVAVQLWMF